MELRFALSAQRAESRAAAVAPQVEALPQSPADRRRSAQAPVGHGDPHHPADLTRRGFDTEASVTADGSANDVMSRGCAKELFQLVTGEYGVPLLRIVSPTLEGAAHLFDAAHDAGRPAAVLVLSAERADAPAKPAGACLNPPRARLLASGEHGGTAAHITDLRRETATARGRGNPSDQGSRDSNLADVVPMPRSARAHRRGTGRRFGAATVLIRTLAKPGWLSE